MYVELAAPVELLAAAYVELAAAVDELEAAYVELAAAVDELEAAYVDELAAAVVELEDVVELEAAAVVELAPAAPHLYISSLFPAPQYSPGVPSQGMLHSESETMVLPLLISFPQ